jgi:hypothetical protein
MKELIRIKRCIRQFKFANYKEEEKHLKDFFLITLAATIKKASFLDERQIKVKLDKNKVKNGLPDTILTFTQLAKKHVEFMTDFTKYAELYPNTMSKIIGDDARKIDLRNRSVDLVITSPPYINAIDYPFAHKQELFILDLVKPENYRPHSREYIGVSERVILKEMFREMHLTDFEPVDKFVKAVYAGGKDVDINRSFIIYQYFSEMEKVLHEIMRVLRTDGNFILFVGSNTIRNHYIPTHELLKQIAEEKIGFTTKTYFYHKMKRKKLGIPRNVTGGEIPTEMAMVFSKE